MLIAAPHVVSAGEQRRPPGSLVKITLISCEQGAAVHPVVGEHAQRFELGVGEQVRLVEFTDR
jgi:hypothetical protein